ncbi:MULTISPECIES: DUF5684 domain-containing protein [Terrabacteria group]|uniref:DUF5684 domain-containing protein n=1 Tax=Bacillati TaxID=1783272 RepID=UPI001939DAD8|nr:MULTISPECIES: DUF5684 domain-containing protein [Terrabacteria group]MBW9212444.1 hypothetical protein [Trueperella sp. zg.1013]QRG86798.1 hypothetical protein JOS54_00310 [Bulleidia sp. zg-1006]
MSKELSSIITTYAIWGIIWYILQSYGHLLLFKKAKVNTVAAFIPFYREFRMFQLTWANKKVALIWAVCILGLPLWWLGSATKIQVMAWFGLFAFIVALVLAAIRSFHETKAFNKGNGLAIGIIFAAPIVNIVLGRSDADYQGAN